MKDPFLLSLSAKKFEEVVKAALNALRSRDWLDLAASDLAHCSLVERCFLEGEARTDLLRGRLLQGVLHWAIDQLRPDGEQSWVENDWRTYNFLSAYYLERVTIEDIANKMGLGEDAPRKRVQPKAITALANFLRKSLMNRQGLNRLVRYVTLARLSRLSEAERWLLGLAALCRQPILLRFFEELGRGNELAALLDNHFLRLSADGTMIELHPALRAAFLTQLSPDERRAGHERLAAYYTARADYLEAAYHYREMGGEGITRAADLLLTHQESIRSQDRLTDLAKLLKTFRDFEFFKDMERWYRLKLLAGDVALATKNVEQAIEEYGQALGAADMTTRISAYHRRAEAYVRLDLDVALTHYEHCIRLLENNPIGPLLLARILIDRAWLSIQERPNLTEAADYLKRVQTNGDSRLEALLANAWAGLLARVSSPSPQEVIKHRLDALRAADESQQRDLQLKMAKNLAFDYAELLKDYDKALHYIQRALTLAREMRDQQLEGICLKDVGNIYFWRKEYRTAIEFYQQAYSLLTKLGNKNWLAAVCFDLAEAYAELGEADLARRYFNEGVELALELRHIGYEKRMEELLRRYPAIFASDLSARQQLIMAYVTKHGCITVSQCMALTEPHMARNAAKKALKQLCERGLLVMVDKGPATRYCLPPDAPTALVPVR